MFSKVDSPRRSKQERMPRLDCEERQINETAHQLMRNSFVEIVLCGQFCFGDLKSVSGGLCASGEVCLSAAGPRRMTHVTRGEGFCSEVCGFERQRETDVEV